MPRIIIASNDSFLSRMKTVSEISSVTAEQIFNIQMMQMILMRTTTVLMVKTPPYFLEDEEMNSIGYEYWSDIIKVQSQIERKYSMRVD